MLFSKKQYQERDAWNAKGSQFQIVPDYLDERETIDWSPVWSITHNCVRYLPTSYLFYGYPVAPSGRFTSWSDSNGAAAGSSFEDAVLQGLYELIERDAVAIWWYNRLQKTAVDLDALQNPFLNEMKDWFSKIDREFWVLDLTTDIGIPTFVCINRRMKGADRGYCDGIWHPFRPQNWLDARSHRDEPIYAGRSRSGRWWRYTLPI